MHIIHRNQYGYAHKIVHNTPLLQKGLTTLSTGETQSVDKVWG